MGFWDAIQTGDAGEIYTNGSFGNGDIWLEKNPDPDDKWTLSFDTDRGNVSVEFIAGDTLEALAVGRSTAERLLIDPIHEVASSERSQKPEHKWEHLRRMEPHDQARSYDLGFDR